MEIHVLFGFVVRQRREELSLTQGVLAELAGIHRTYLSDIERGCRNISLLNIESIANALQISISELFRRAEQAAQTMSYKKNEVNDEQAQEPRITPYLARAIVNLRKKLEINQETLARSTKISQDHLSKIERGQKVPTLRMIEAIADALQLSILSLFFFAEKEKQLEEETK